MNELPNNKEIAVLSHLAEIHKLIGDDVVLSDKIAGQIDALPIGKDLRALVITKRIRWTYYSEKFALELKGVLDMMIETRKPQQFLLSEHPRMTVRTLYLKIYQPWMWLIDYHPNRAAYKKLKDETFLPQRQNVGVQILFRDGVESPLHSKEVNPNADVSTLLRLQNKISDFLDRPLTEDALFDEKGLALTPEDIQILRDSCAGLPSDRVVVNIAQDRVRILRKVSV